MGASAMIVSSDVLTLDDFQGVVHGLGGFIKCKVPPRGVISEGETDVWLAMLSRDDFGEFYDEEDMLGWQSVLKAAPQTIVEVRLDHTQRSKVLYLGVALGFAKVCNCVLHDIDESVLSYDAICEKYRRLVG
ncbi:hypothetical protein [Pseudomonas chlororaphis]|uniref:hypothetical protein n=1 Tax=Pseudomonas chlororaphis TaxID=587753 RepID=UPI0039E2CA8A